MGVLQREPAAKFCNSSKVHQQCFPNLSDHKNHLEFVKHMEFPSSSGESDSIGLEVRPWILNKTLEHFKLNT